jgi:lipopolysaccharide export system permease protein
MRRLHWLILKRLPGPFFGWLGTLMFLLLMQFLIRWLPEIAGKGIPLPVILELIAYNLAYMVVLAVPMSVLLASLMAFGSLAESQYYAVIKSTGISFGQIVWPALIVSALITGGMTYFNAVLLPEANYRARHLWQDIRSKRPGFEIRPGVFYGGVEDYSILVGNRPEGTNRLSDITIYDYTRGRRRQAVIKAERGFIQSSAGGTTLTLVLRDGEMHRSLPPDANQPSERYERLSFDRHAIRFDLSDFAFKRSRPDDDRRSDRTMRTATMLAEVDSLRQEIDEERRGLREQMRILLTPDSTASGESAAMALPDPSTAGASDTTVPPTRYTAFSGLTTSARIRLASLSLRTARSAKSEARDVARSTSWRSKRIQRYRVEIYKKFSIAVACLIFMFIGAPLGLSIRRGGLATIGGIALGIFMFYWVTLVQGEKLADRGLLPPWLGMWIANVIMLAVGIWMTVYVVLDLRATPPLRRRLVQWAGSLIGAGDTPESPSAPSSSSSASDGPASDGPTSDGPASDGPASDGPASDGPSSGGP